MAKAEYSVCWLEQANKSVQVIILINSSMKYSVFIGMKGKDLQTGIYQNRHMSFELKTS